MCESMLLAFPYSLVKIWTEYHKTKDGVCAVIPVRQLAHFARYTGVC